MITLLYIQTFLFIMGWIAHMVHQFPSSLPLCLVMIFINVVITIIIIIIISSSSSSSSSIL